MKKLITSVMMFWLCVQADEAKKPTDTKQVVPGNKESIDTQAKLQELEKKLKKTDENLQNEIKSLQTRVASLEQVERLRANTGK